MRLQTRIALSAAAAVLAAVALFGVGAYYLISERAYDRLDSSLNDTATRVAGELAGPDVGGRDFAEPPTAGRSRPADAQRQRRPRRHARPAGSPRQDAAERPAHRDPPGRALPPAGARPAHRLGRQPADGGRGPAAHRRRADAGRGGARPGRSPPSSAALLATGLALLIVRGALRPLTQARQAAEDRRRQPGPVGAGARGAAPTRSAASRAPSTACSGAWRTRRAACGRPSPSSAASPPTRRTRCARPLTALRGDIETMRGHDLPAAEREAALSDMADVGRPHGPPRPGAARAGARGRRRPRGGAGGPRRDDRRDRDPRRARGGDARTSSSAATARRCGGCWST